MMLPRGLPTLQRQGQATKQGSRQLVCRAATQPSQLAPPTAAPAAPTPTAAAPVPLAPPASYVQPPTADSAVAAAPAVSESAAVAQAPYGYDPRLYQGAPVRQEYYVAPPPGYYPPIPPPQSYQKEEAASSGAPWWIWLGAGVLLGQVLSKVQDYMKNPKTPQQIMAEMAMKQMMGAMGNGAGAGASPFGGASPLGSSPFPGFPPTPTPAVDITATAVPPSPSSTESATSGASGAATNGKPGSKFASRLNGEGREASVKPEAPKSTLDVVEPVVKEPSSGTASSSTASSSRTKSSFFSDVTDVTGDSASTSSGPSSSSSSASSGSSEGSVMTSMMEQMLRNPEMQKMLYPYLPEPMRNPSSIEWMLNNPEVKKQMEQMFSSQGVMTPQMQELMKGMDFNQEKVNKQFAELGLKPEDVISKVVANPELAAGFSNPKVQAAIVDISSNPMNIVKYQEDPEIMKVLEKVTEIFQPSIPPGMRK